MENFSLDANLIKKYHQDLVYDYAQYPTKDHWSYNFKSEDYKKSLADWLRKNKEEPIVFYVHTPFCEQLCYFCLCSKVITQDYDKAKEYLYKYMFKEIDILFDFLKEKKVKLNVKEIFFGGGSPTFYNREDFKNLVDKLKGLFDFSKVGDFTVEIDPRRVDEDRLLFNHKLGVNRLSFGLQDFDPEVQRRVNRIQPPELFKKLLTKKVREAYKTINFDLLIGLPSQTNESMTKTLDQIIDLRPTQVQLGLMAYKPWVGKHQIKMVEESPLPDFLDRKELFKIINKKLPEAGYVRVGFESYALPNDPLAIANKEGKAYYNSCGLQKGAATNFVAVGSSGKSELGDDYYSQSYYDLPSYKKCLDKGILPTYRGMKLSNDDKIRKHITQKLRTYFKVDFKEFERNFNINFKEYFSNELEHVEEMANDGLITFLNDSIEMTELGTSFSQNITNVFDKYDPPTKSYAARLATVKKAKNKEFVSREL